MSRNGSGTFVLTDTFATAGAIASSTTVNSIIDDIADGLTDSVNKDGTKAWSANQPMGGFKFTGMGVGSSRTDSLRLGQSQDGTLNWIDGGGTADAITATYSPAITALVDGQLCFVRATAANATTTPTFAPNGLTARTIVKGAGTALAVGDIVGDQHELMLRYDLSNTRWCLLNPKTILVATTTEALTGTDAVKAVTPDALAALWEKGADVASAGTTSLAEGGYGHVTGTTTITDIDFATAKDGRGYIVQFDGILTLTHHATTLVLPGGANITTAAGDTACFVQDSSDNIKCVWYTKASGKPLVDIAGYTYLEKASDQTVTSSTTLTDITGLTFSVAANTNYEGSAILHCFQPSSGGGIGFKFGAAGPASPTFVNIWGFISDSSAGSPQRFAVNSLTSLATAQFKSASDTYGGVEVRFLFQNGANAGTFSLQFAQDTSSGTAISLKKGSLLKYRVAA